MKPTLVVLMLAAVLFAHHARADEHSELDQLDTLVVTATRTSINRDEALVPVIVIGRDDIARSGARDLAELLRFHAGIEIARSGGPGAVTTVFVRGTDSNHTLVLVDGVEINPGTIGGAAVQNIDPELVERVEIVKGPRSSLYGSKAIGGVINVITRRSRGGADLRAGLGAGSDAARELSAAGVVAGANAQLGLSASHRESDGYPVRTGSELARGFRNTSLSANSSVELGAVRAALRHWQARGVSEYLGFFLEPLEQAFVNRSTALELGWGSRHWRSSLQASRVVEDIEQRQSTDFVRTERDVLDWQNDLQLGRAHRVLAGVTVTGEQTEGMSFGAALDDGDGDGQVRTRLREVYLADDFDIGAHSFLLAARYTDHDTAGSQTTWNAEYGYAAGSATRLSASAGTAFRAPDSTDRFGYGGNPALAPETSLNLELGLRHSIGASQRIEAHLFHNEIDDLIEFVTLDTMTFQGENRNIARARIRGAEIAYQLDEELWRLRLNATLQDPENRDSGMALLRRAQHVVNGELMRRFGVHELALGVLASGEREDFGVPEPVMLPSYLLVDLSATLRFGAHWTLRARVENLLDEDYETVAGFPAASRGTFVNVSYALR